VFGFQGVQQRLRTFVRRRDHGPAAEKMVQMVDVVHGKKSAGEISEKFSLTGATVSYHLSKLKAADLICEEKNKNFIYYRLNTSVFEEVLTWIYGLGGKSNEKN